MRGTVIIGKDEDFVHRASQPSAAVRLVWIRIANCRKKDLITAIGLVWPRIVACLEAGDRIVEIR